MSSTPLTLPKNITMQDIEGKRFTLESYRGRALLLSFYRYATCPLCNLQIQRIAKAYPAWHEAGLEVIAVFESEPTFLAKTMERNALPFRVVADPTSRLYGAFGLRRSWRALLKAWIIRFPTILYSIFIKRNLPGKIDGPIDRIPADFLISRDFTLHLARYGSDIGDHIDIATVEKFLNEEVSHAS